jgi:tetratricopeptide (TPR) repeat protein
MALAAGARLGRYELLGFIGAGGMGEVYEGRDTRLGRIVALKVLPPYFAPDPARRHRFELEARAVSALEHPNICVLHDVGSEGDVDFLVLERLEGETLAERLRRGPLPRGEALPIAIQIASALEAAHRKGIIHRDLKPGNVMLTRAGAKLLDFGLARLRGEAAGEDVSTAVESGEPGKAVGTRPYMSPEQASGVVSDARSDVWALGVVLYEMLAGHRPFHGDSAESLSTAILEHEPAALSSAAPETPLALDHVVRRCLAKDPADRWQSAGDVGRELGWISEGRSAEAVASPRSRRVLAAVAAVSLAVAIAWSGLVLWSSRPTKPLLDPRRVVVAVFENRTGDPSLDVLGRMAADHISEGLARLPGISIALDPALPLAREGGAGLVVSGAYYLQGDEVRVLARLTEAATGRLTALDPTSGPRTAPSVVLEVARQRVLGAVAVRFDPTWAALVGEELPTYEAYQEYLAGVERTSHDGAAAAAHFTRVLEIQPGFVPARLWLVALCVNRGDYPAAARHLAVLEQERPRLTPFQKLKVAARHAQLAGRIEESYVAAREAKRLVPQDAREAFFFAYLAGNANHHREAVEALTAPLDWKRFHEQSGSSSSMHFWNLSESLHLLGEYERELAEVRRGQEMHPQDIGLRTAEAHALVALGRLDETTPVVNAGLSLASGMRGHAYLLFGTAVEMRLHGHPGASALMTRRALEWLRSRPPEEFTTREARASLAWALSVAEHWDEAQGVYQQLAREAPDDVRWLGNLGFLAARRGDHARALSISEQLRVAKHPYLLGQNTRWRASIAGWLGEKDQAVELLRAAFAEGVWHDLAVHQDLDLEPLRGYPPFEDLVKPR